MKISWNVAIKTVSEANSSEHWSKKSKRHKQQQFFVRLALMDKIHQVTLPCVVTLTRLSSRILDDDNLISAFKKIRDEISEMLIRKEKVVYVNKTGKIIQKKGMCDNDPRIKWEYAQEKHVEKKIRIDIAY